MGVKRCLNYSCTLLPIMWRTRLDDWCGTLFIFDLLSLISGRISLYELDKKKRSKSEVNKADILRKKMKNQGKAYVNRKGKQVEGKTLGQPCGSTCRYRCTENFPENTRQSIFNKFWCLGDRKKQWEFVVNNTDKVPTKRPRAKNPIRHRAYTIDYYLSLEGKHKKRVCKTTFLSTIGSGERIITSAWSKYYGRTVVDDKRGKRPYKRK